MSAIAADDTLRSFTIVKETRIAAPLEIAFEAILEEMGPGGEGPGGIPLPRVLEPWPGGRWYRDLGNNAGHLWGHVQVIKPPTLVEICGPLFMSYACVNHVQYRLTADGNDSRLTLTHRAMGQISEEHQRGVHSGWEHVLFRVAQLAAKRGLRNV